MTQKEPVSKKSVKQMPKYDERYYYISDSGVIISTPWYSTDSDIFRFNTGNCFKTKQEAEDYKENILTKQALKDIERVVRDEMCDTLGCLCVYCDGKNSCITFKILDIINKAKDGNNE